MTDPPRRPIFDSTLLLSEVSEGTVNSPTISISHASNDWPPGITTNGDSVWVDSHGADTTANALSTRDERELFQYYPDDLPNSNAPTTHPELQLIPSATTAPETAHSRLPTLGSFGSQPWSAPHGPYLDFTHQARYEPTGELLSEQPKSFQSFDSPRSIISSSSSPQIDTIRAPAANSSSRQPPDAAASSTLFAPPPLPKSVLKRKAESSSSQAAEPGSKKRQQQQQQQQQNGEALLSVTRSVSFERMSRPNTKSPGDASSASDQSSGPRAPSANASTRRGRPTGDTAPTSRALPDFTSTETQSPSTPRPARPSSAGAPPSILPPEKVFPIQIGSELFRLSGASISSDAPSYFTQFFEEQVRLNEDSGGVRTLYIDRDPITFRDVARHLQGYHVKPQDGSQFVKLFADAQFYSLPRLIDQLFESEIFIQIGDRHFQIPKDLFSDPGNSPNFFSLGFAVFFSTPGEVFPGLDRRGLLRPPSIVPPYVPGRSADIFAQLVHLLRGYPLDIRDENHRAELLRDCRYFHLRGLEQKLISNEISYNLERQKHEICIRLEDVKPSGVTYRADSSRSESAGPQGWVTYARPFVDDEAYELIVEISGESTILDLNDMRADFHGLAKARVASLLQVIANKMNMEIKAPLGLMMLSGEQGEKVGTSPGHTPLSEDRVKVSIEESTSIVLDGKDYEVDWTSKRGAILLHGPPPPELDTESDVLSEASAPPPPPSQQKRAPRRQLPQPASSKQPSLSVPPLQTSKLPTSSKKRKLDPSVEHVDHWTIPRGQWRLRVQSNPHDTIRGGLEVVLVAVKLDAFSGERARNTRRPFLRLT